MTPMLPPPPHGSLPLDGDVGGRTLVSVRMMSIIASAMYIVLAAYQLVGALTLRYRSTVLHGYYVSGGGYRVEDTRLAEDYVHMVSGYAWIVAALTVACASLWTFVIIRTARRRGHTDLHPLATAILWLVPFLGPPLVINHVRRIVRTAGESDRRQSLWLHLLYGYAAFYVVTAFAVNAGFDGRTDGLSILAAINREVTVSYFNVVAVGIIAVAAARAMLHTARTVDVPAMARLDG